MLVNSIVKYKVKEVSFLHVKCTVMSPVLSMNKHVLDMLIWEAFSCAAFSAQNRLLASIYSPLSTSRFCLYSRVSSRMTELSKLPKL